MLDLDKALRADSFCALKLQSSAYLTCDVNCLNLLSFVQRSSDFVGHPLFEKNNDHEQLRRSNTIGSHHGIQPPRRHMRQADSLDSVLESCERGESSRPIRLSQLLLYKKPYTLVGV